MRHRFNSKILSKPHALERERARAREREREREGEIESEERERERERESARAQQHRQLVKGVRGSKLLVFSALSY